MTIALEHPVGTIDPVTLLNPELMNRLIHRVTTDHPEISADTARRIVGQAAAFVAASGLQPGQSLAPSELVDHGWHAFILHTVDYAAFCQQVVGRFVHHVPTDEDEATPGGAAAARERTLAVIDAVYSVYGAAWFTDPTVLLPAVRERLRPGGVLVFSQRPAAEGCYDCQASYIQRGADEDPLIVKRWDYEPAAWEQLLKTAATRTSAPRCWARPPASGRSERSSFAPALRAGHRPRPDADPAGAAPCLAVVVRGEVRGAT